MSSAVAERSRENTTWPSRAMTSSPHFSPRVRTATDARLASGAVTAPAAIARSSAASVPSGRGVRPASFSPAAWQSAWYAAKHVLADAGRDGPDLAVRLRAVERVVVEDDRVGRLGHVLARLEADDGRLLAGGHLRDLEVLEDDPIAADGGDGRARLRCRRP